MSNKRGKISIARLVNCRTFQMNVWCILQENTVRPTSESNKNVLVIWPEPETKWISRPLAGIQTFIPIHAAPAWINMLNQTKRKHFWPRFHSHPPNGPPESSGTLHNLPINESAALKLIKLKCVKLNLIKFHDSTEITKFKFGAK